MHVRHVVNDVAMVVDAVASSQGRPSLSLHTELDVDVYRLSHTGSGPDLVVRAFDHTVERSAVDAAAHVLQRLAGTRFPAERCPAGDPVLPIGDDRHLLVTAYIERSPAPGPGFVVAWCAALLGRLATRSGAELPPGGGWHRLGATPSREINEALRLGAEVGPSVAELVDALGDADDATGLPESLIHADLTPPNVIPQGDQPPVVIDWIGVGRGPRVWPLALLLFAAGPRAARRGLERYARSIALTGEETHRLPGLMITRPLTLDLWSVAHERMSVQQALTRHHARRNRIDSIAAALNNADCP
ncbi:phosphotransferase [Leekyejoonella antrihumi]|uniref:Aminoglycoside phosphotransferase domain-containing protein n=1 Tax=Leekyejoonella antrihumi TaxID=1660198 RepID=A0A563E4K5_9MICO|nr:phosphotransferase [Leekyejoonella antrihumi]TWP37436.1 hypothetical protein FGL98_06740 [Leekyejoonella antrihumi]